MPEPRKLRVFLCHSSQDKPVVRELYRQLFVESWIDPWLDEEKLLPGQEWDPQIKLAVETADAVIICMSSDAVKKEGYIQKELRFALEIALEKPDETIFIIPLRFDDCFVPRRLREYHYIDYFPVESREKNFNRLRKALQKRLEQLVIREEAEERVRKEAEEKALFNARQKDRQQAEEKAKQEREARAQKEKERRNAEKIKRKQEEEEARLAEKEKKAAEELAKKEAEERERQKVARRLHQRERRRAREKTVLDFEKDFGFTVENPSIEYFPMEAPKTKNRSIFGWLSIILFVLFCLLMDAKAVQVAAQNNQWQAGALLTIWLIGTALLAIWPISLLAYHFFSEPKYSDVSIKYGDVIDDNLILLFTNGILGSINLNTKQTKYLDKGHGSRSKFFVLSQYRKIIFENGDVIDIDKAKRGRRLKNTDSYNGVLAVNQRRNILAIKKTLDVDVREFAKGSIAAIRIYPSKMVLFTSQGTRIIVVQNQMDKEKQETISHFEIWSLEDKKKVSHTIPFFQGKDLSFVINNDDSLLAIGNDDLLTVYSFVDNKVVYRSNLKTPIHSMSFLHKNNLLAVSLTQEMLVLDVSNRKQYSLSYRPRAVSNIRFLPATKEILGIDKPKGAIYRWRIEDVMGTNSGPSV